MINETLETETLASLAQKFTRYAVSADEHTIKAAKLIKEAQERVAAGDAGKITWTEWAEKNIKLSGSRVRELLRIAKADDPKKELERVRVKNKERVARHRAKQKSAPLHNGAAAVEITAEMEGDRKSLIAWAQTAQIDHVTALLSHARVTFPAAAISTPDDHIEG